MRCAAGLCIKSVKSVFRARVRRAGAMRGGLQFISRAIVLSLVYLVGQYRTIAVLVYSVDYYIQKCAAGLFI